MEEADALPEEVNVRGVEGEGGAGGGELRVGAEGGGDDDGVGGGAAALEGPEELGLGVRVYG